MRILIISHSFFPAIGGIETVGKTLAEYFQQKGHQVDVLTWTQNKYDEKELYGVTRVPSVKQIFRAVRKSDIILENNLSLRLSWPLLFFRKSHVIILHTWINHQKVKTLLYRLKKWWLSRASRVIAVSEHLKRKTFTKAAVIANFYNDNVFKIYPKVKKESDFVFLGRLVSDKGADMALQLLDRLNNSPSSRKRFKLTIIGEGKEERNLKNQVRHSNLSDDVSFTGSLKDMELAVALNKHKYILVPSRWEEPFGIVALEGMACGCIPIVADDGGLPEAVGGAGVIFKRNNIESFYAEVKRLLENPLVEEQLRSRFGAHLQEHTVAAVCSKYEAILAEENKSNEKLKVNTFAPYRQC